MSRARGEHLHRLPIGVLQRRPIDEVVGGGDENVGHVEVHPVLAVHPRRDEPVAHDTAEDRARLRLRAQVLPALRRGERGTVLGPGEQVARRGDREAWDVAIPLRVRQHVRAVVGLDETRVFHAAGPLVRALRVAVGEEHGRIAAREAQPVGALGETEPRRVAADLLVAAAVFGPVEQHHLPVPHDGGRIEGGVLLPPHRGVADRRAKRGRAPRCEHGVHLTRLLERPDHPIARGLRAEGSGAGRAEREHDERAGGGAGEHR